MSNFFENSLDNLVEKISSNAPVPGGGAVSAFSAVIASALCEMVVGLTVGKKIYNGYDDATKEKITKIAENARELQKEFKKLFEADNKAFEEVMVAMKLPKETDEEKEFRKKSIEESYKVAMEVPLTVAQKMLTFYENIEFMVRNGNSNCITDGAVGSLQAFAAIQGAILNVRINLGGISDQVLVENMKKECDRIINVASKINSSVIEYANSVM